MCPWNYNSILFSIMMTIFVTCFCIIVITFTVLLIKELIKIGIEQKENQ